MFLTGDVTANSEWPASNSPYVLPGQIAVHNGVILTVDSGSVVKPEAGIEVVGTLNAAGAVFTSFHDDSAANDTDGDSGATAPAPGDWGPISFDPGNANDQNIAGGTGTLTGDVFKYGGKLDNGYYDEGEIFVNDNYYNPSTGQVTAATPVSISGSTVSYSQGSGIYVWSGNPSVHYDDIFANSIRGITNQGAIGYNTTQSSGSNLDLTHNYWGSKHGPKPYGFGNGFNGPDVIAPWSRIPFTGAGAAYQASLGMKDYCAVCGDPINTATGAFVYQHTDVKVPTKGVPLEFDRTYNSNDASDGDLGFGWSYNWQISVNPLANGNVTVLRGDGSQDVFTLNPDGSYSPPSLGVHDTLVRNADGTFKLTTKDQITYNFDLNNELASEVSEAGQSTAFAYNANLQLTAITEPAGRSLSLVHDALTGRITQITDPNGKTIAFAYSAAGDLTSVTDQNGGTTKFAYDTNHHITGVTDADNHTQANNTYDATGKVTSQTDAEGKLITFTYDTTNYVTTMTRQMDPNDHSKDQTTTFYYDSQYRLIKETDPYGKSTTYTYDAAGDRDTVTDRRGTITKQLYDPSGNITDIYKAYGLPGQEHT